MHLSRPEQTYLDSEFGCGNAGNLSLIQRRKNLDDIDPDDVETV